MASDLQLGGLWPFQPDSCGSVEKSSDSGSSLIVMTRPDMDDIPDVPFPEGYGIRPMTTDDIGLWTDIERDAERYVEVSGSVQERVWPRHRSRRPALLNHHRAAQPGCRHDQRLV